MMGTGSAAHGQPDDPARGPDTHPRLDSPRLDSPDSPRPSFGADPDATALRPAELTVSSTADTAMDQPVLVENTGAVIARHGATMATGSVISRATGFLRTAAIGAAIGAAAVADDYNLANTLPGMVYELLLGGVLASVVVPLLVRARTRDADRGEAYTHRLLSLAVVFLAGATVVAVALAPLLTSLLTSGSTPAADRHLITTLSYLLLPMIFFYGMAALFAAVLNTRGHFKAPAWAPILNNIVVIAVAGAFITLPVATPLQADSLTAAAIALLGLGTMVGIVVQTAGLLPALRRVGFRWRWRWDLRALHLGELARISAWVFGYVVVSQIGIIVVLNIAKRASDAGDPSGQAVPGPAIFNNAYLIFMMAHGIIAVSIITVLLPRMSAAAAEGRHRDLAHHLSLGARLIGVVLVPTTVAYALLGRPIAVTLFEWGEYSHAQAVATGWVIAMSGLGLIPFAVSQLQIFSFYAMPDSRTPTTVNVLAVAVRIAVDVFLYLVLPVVWVAAGLMAGNAVSFLAAAALGYLLLRRRLGPLGLRSVMRTLGRLCLAAVAAAVPTVVVVIVLQQLLGEDKVGSAVQLVAGGVVLVGAYLGACLLLRVDEVHRLTALLRARS